MVIPCCTSRRQFSAVRGRKVIRRTFCLLCRQLVQLNVIRMRFRRVWSPGTPAG